MVKMDGMLTELKRIELTTSKLCLKYLHHALFLEFLATQCFLQVAGELFEIAVSSGVDSECPS